MYVITISFEGYKIIYNGFIVQCIKKHCYI